MTLFKKISACLVGLVGLLVMDSAHVDASTTVRLGSVVRVTADGRMMEMNDDDARRQGAEVAKMTQADAKRFCEAKGKRLPSILQLAQALNPRGVRTDAGFDLDLQPIRKADGSFDFFFDSRTFVTPAGDLGYQQFWSSSGHPRGVSYGYIFDAMMGEIDSDLQGEEVVNKNSVVCVRR